MLASGKRKAEIGVICLAMNWLKDRSAEPPSKAMKHMDNFAQTRTPLKEGSAGESVMREIEMNIPGDW